MPYVNIKITREGATADQKSQLIRGVTQLLVDVLGKNPQTTVVVIDEVDTDNWGIGGETVTALRKKGPDRPCFSFWSAGRKAAFDRRDIGGRRGILKPAV